MQRRRFAVSSDSQAPALAEIPFQPNDNQRSPQGMFRQFVLSSLLAAASVPAIAAPQKYAIDQNHTYIVFSYDHFGFSHPTARLDRISGELELDTADLSRSSVSVTLPLDGLSTGVAKLDADLKSPGFFDAGKYPDITFRSTRVEKAGANGLKISGELTVHGVTLPITLDAKVNKIGDNPMSGRPSAGFDARTTLKRSDFGVSRMLPMVGDEITVHVSLDSHLAR
jgi:polyisoprenoid-binding protein YceI